MSASLVQTDGTRFAADVLAASQERPVLVDFWAQWCGPCLALAPLLERLAADLTGRLVVAKIDVDREPELANRYAVRALPTLKLFRRGVIVDELIGMQSPAALRALVDRHLDKPSDAALARARGLLASDDAASAVSILRDAAQMEPDHWPLQIELGAALLATNDVAGADAIVRALPANVAEDAASRVLRARVEFARAVGAAPPRAALERRVAENPDDLEGRYLLGARRVLDGDPEAGLEQLLEVMRRNRAFRDDLGRRSLVTAFEIVGNDYPHKALSRPDGRPALLARPAQPIARVRRAIRVRLHRLRLRRCRAGTRADRRARSA
jgi:putative thioredoxin